VADGAVISQFVVFKPSLYTVRVESSAVASDPGKHEPGVGGWVVGSGKAKGQLNVAVAVWTDPSMAVASAIITALPVPKALATPAFDLPCDPLLFVLTGKVLGVEESQVTVLVTSLTVGAVENVPIAKNWPVACKFPTVMALGIMVRDSRGSGAAVSVTVTVAEAVTTEPSALVSSAVIVLVPTLTPWASPVELTVAIDGTLELHFTSGESVTSLIRPVPPEVPSAINCPVWPEADSDSESGVTVIAVNDCDVPPTTVNVAVPVATVPSAFVKTAVIVVVPFPIPVASPAALMMPTWALLEVQTTWLVRLKVAPVDVVPMAMNWAVCCGALTD
jgi:hypothetical protein